MISVTAIETNNFEHYRKPGGRRCVGTRRTATGAPEPTYAAPWAGARAPRPARAASAPRRRDPAAPTAARSAPGTHVRRARPRPLGAESTL